MSEEREAETWGRSGRSEGQEGQEGPERRARASPIATFIIGVVCVLIGPSIT